ncbi:hypothetical protein ES703_20402 [subsurface metagenome]
MFAPESAAHIGHNNADALGRNSESVGQISLHRLGAIDARPHGQLAVSPLRYCRPWFHWRMLNIGDFVGLLQDLACVGKAFVNRAAGSGTGSSARPSIFLEMGKQILARWMRNGFPGRGFGNSLQRLGGTKRRRRGASHELTLTDDDNILHGLGFGKIDRFKRGTIRGGTQNFSVEHIWTHDIRRITVRSGDKVPPVRPGDGGAEHLPFVDRCKSYIGVDGLCERPGNVLCFGQICIGDSLLRCLVLNSPIVYIQGTGVNLPLLGCKTRQKLAGGRSGTPHGGDRGRSRPAAGSSTIIRDESRISHYQANSVNGNPQLFRRGLRQLRSRALAFFDLTGHDGNCAILVDVESCRDGYRLSAATDGDALGHRDQETRTEQLYKGASAQLDLTCRLLSPLRSLWLELFGKDISDHKLLPLYLFSGATNGIEDFRISVAPTQVDIHLCGNLFICRVRVLFKQRHCRQNHSGCAIPALHRPFCKEGFLNRMQGIARGQSFDSSDSLLISLSHGDKTRQDTFAIHQDAAGTAAALAAAVLGTGQMQLLPQDIKKRPFRVGGDGPFYSINSQANRHIHK